METVKRWSSKLFQCVVPRKLKALSAKNVKEDTFPSEIIEDILSRLPVKSILRFKSVSKQWHSVISNLSFTKLQHNRATADHRTALFITFDDDVTTRKRYVLTAAHAGGSLIHLMTLNLPRVTKSEHVNGLVLSFSTVGQCKEAFVLNPSTHNIFKLPDPSPGIKDVHYFFGFDESRNEHKVLMLLGLESYAPIQIMIFSMSNCSWRKIDATVGIDINHGWFDITKTSSVCVNSRIHFMILRPVEIMPYELNTLAFDLKTEKFSIVKVPMDATEWRMWWFRSDYIYCHYLKIHGCVGVVFHDLVGETFDMRIWILQDYENNFWVIEYIKLPSPWRAMGCPVPVDSLNMDEIIFSLSNLNGKVVCAPIYNIENGRFRFIEFTLNHPFLRSLPKKFRSLPMKSIQILCYLESMLPV